MAWWAQRTEIVRRERTHCHASLHTFLTPYTLPTIRYRPLTGSGGVDRQIAASFEEEFAGDWQEWGDIETDIAIARLQFLGAQCTDPHLAQSAVMANVLVVVTDRHAPPRCEEIQFKRAKHDVAFHTDTIQSENQRVCAY